jgi:group I intron endonuclease
MFINEIININNICYNLEKITIIQPYNNKKLLLKYLKKKQGIYIFQSIDNINIYVGHSINLYTRINSYFMPSILNTKARKVLRYFNKHGFNKFNLVIYILDIKYKINDLLGLEQYFINLLKPNLNVDLIAKGTGYHHPMTEKMRIEQRLLKGTKIYIYCQFCYNLVYISNSKQDLINKIKIHHKTLKSCIEKNIIYLNLFLIKNELLNKENKLLNKILLNEIEFINFLIIIKQFHFVKHPHLKAVIAEFKDKNNHFKKEFVSINALKLYLKGDKTTICKYLNNKNNNNKLYREK